MRIFLQKFDPSIAIAIVAVVLLIAQMLFLSEQFDAYSLLRDREIKVWQIPFAYSGDVAKLFLLIAAIYLLIKRDELSGLLKKHAERIYPARFSAIIGLQLLCFIGLLILTRKIFAVPEESHRAGFPVYIAWVICAAVVFALWLYALFPKERLVKYILREKKSLSLAFVLGFFILFVALASRELWSYLADTTFAVSRFLLSFYAKETLYSIPEERVLGVGDFAVSISSACSGYEGIGLIVGFTAIYLFLSREKYKFPQALLLFPLGSLLIWLLNCVRIAALIIIGDRWSPDVAVGGFHSYAGWIAFILVSLFILFVAGRSKLWLKTAESVWVADSTRAPLEIIAPFVALMATTLLTSAMSTDFDYVYPIRVVVVGAVIVIGWRRLGMGGYKFRYEPVLAAVAVAALWILLLGKNSTANASFAQGLESMPTMAAAVWLMFRLIGSVVTVPIAEELAFRGYLLCKLSGTDSFVRGRVPFSALSIIFSSIAFGLLHVAWLAGILAGLIFALVRLRSLHIGDAIVCHIVVNLFIFMYAALTGNWFVV